MVKADTLSGPLCSSAFDLGFNLVQPANAGAENHAAAKGVLRREIEARVADRVDAGDHGKLREAVNAPSVFDRHVIAGRPIVDVAAEMDLIALVSNSRISWMPLSPPRIRFQRSSTWQPSEVTAPSPVTTTRRLLKFNYDWEFSMY